MSNAEVTMTEAAIRRIKYAVWEECAAYQHRLTSIDSISDDLSLANPYRAVVEPCDQW